MQAQSMPSKFYQFDYAVMEYNKIIQLGILGFESERTVSTDILKQHMQSFLHKPLSDISISNITRITQEEFVEIKAQEKAVPQ